MPVTNLTAIFVFAFITYLCRAGGFWAMRHVPFTPPVRRALEALPGSVMAAIIVPGVLASGVPGFAGVAVAMLTMKFVKKDLAAMVFGCATAALLRAAGF